MTATKIVSLSILFHTTLHSHLNRFMRLN